MTEEITATNAIILDPASDWEGSLPHITTLLDKPALPNISHREIWLSSTRCYTFFRTATLISASLGFAGIAGAQSAALDQYEEPYRPQYHFSPEKGWIGDPDGLIHYKGSFSLFWWGKATSTDLVHYTPHPERHPRPGKDEAVSRRYPAAHRRNARRRIPRQRNLNAVRLFARPKNRSHCEVFC